MRHTPWYVLTLSLAFTCFSGSSLGAADLVPADAVAVLTKAARSGAGSDQRFAAVNAAVRCGPGAIAPLLETLVDMHAAVREDGARALGRLSAQSATEPLISLLDDAEPAVRGTAAEALGKIGGDRAKEALLKLLARDDESTRRGAAVGAGYLGSVEAIPALRRMCGASNWEERWRAVVALGKIGDNDPMPLLSRLAAEPDPVVAACADWAIGVLVGRPDPRLLTANLRHRDAAVVWGSAWALGVIGSEAATAALRQAAARDENAGQAATTVLLWLGSEAPAAPPAAAPTGTPASPGATPAEPLDLEARWQDRYGQLQLTATVPRPLVLVGAQDINQAGTPFLLRLGSGEHLLTYDLSPHAEGAERATIHSLEGGQTWTPRAALVRRATALAALQNGSVLAYDDTVFHREGRDFVAQMCVSRDRGESFGPLQLVHYTARVDDVGTPVDPALRKAYADSSARWSDRVIPGLRGRVVQLGEDDLMGCGQGPVTPDDDQGIVCYRSIDSGLTWTRASSLPGEGLSEPALMVTATGRLICVASRGPDQRMARFESYDQGETWQEGSPLPKPGQSPDLCRLSNGVLVCGYGGQGIRLMFSVDGSARQWTDHVLIDDIESDEGDGPSLAEGKAGQLLIVYSRKGTALLTATVDITKTAPGK